MNPYVTGEVIKSFREKQGLTQLQLAEKLSVSDKTISKWETARGYPDIAVLEPLARALNISVTELLSGETVQNTNPSANMLRTKFYVCPVCGNVIQSIGQAMVSCHGIVLPPQETEETNAQHRAKTESAEEDYFITIDHEMRKTHYISFVAAIYFDRVEIIKLYPEGNAEVRVPKRALRSVLFYCNRDGLFRLKL